MCGVQPVRRRLGDAGEETTDRVLLAEREEPLQQTALVHHLDAARVQAERADNPGRLRLLLQHERVHAVQPQLAGQHQAGRSTAGNDHVNHEIPLQQGCISASCSAQSDGAHTRTSAGSRLGRQFCGTTRVLPQGPPVRHILSGKEWVTALPLPFVVRCRCGRASSSRSGGASRPRYRKPASVARFESSLRLARGARAPRGSARQRRARCVDRSSVPQRGRERALAPHPGSGGARRPSGSGLCSS